MAWVATAVVGGAALGAAANIYSSGKAADAQTQAAQIAAQTQMAMYQQTRKDLSPFRDIGTGAATELTKQLPSLTAPIVMDQASLEKTPGYQFNLKQGLKATQNAAAARGLGVSGAALKGAATFATGLADSTYQNQFNNANINKTNAFNRLDALVNTGENAAAQTGAAGTSAANATSSAQIGAGNAQAAGYNAAGAAVSNAAGGIGGYYAYKGLYGGDSGGTNSYGGGSPFTGDAYGGSASSPLAGLTSADYA